MGLVLINNYILLSVLIFIADLCVAAAYEAILLMHTPKRLSTAQALSR
jgi:hypothetical protein